MVDVVNVDSLHRQLSTSVIIMAYKHLQREKERERESGGGGGGEVRESAVYE